MKPTKIILLFVFSIFCVSFSYGTMTRVTSDADGGPGSLRDVVGAAAPGDTVRIDVSGTLFLNSPLQITTPVYIMGPYPSRFKIDVNGIPFTSNAVIISANNVVIDGIGFIGGNALNYVAVQNYTGVVIKHCAFEGKSGSNGSALQIENGQMKVESCSFISNTSDGRGGAIGVMGTGTADLVNSTFYDNSALLEGDAVYIDVNANYKISHCTFKGNYGNSAAVYDDGVSLVAYTFQSSTSIYVDNTLGFDYPSGLIASFSTLGGNVIENGSFGLLSSGNDNWVASNAQVSLPTMPTTDGFGLSHFVIGSATSQAIDIGGMTAQPSPTKDARMMPRQLFGDTGLEVDAGAVEFTPYYVDDLGGGSTNMHSLGWCIEEINATGFPGPYVIDFRLPGPGPHMVVQTDSYTITKDEVIINGFSQEGSIIPGPNVIGHSQLTKAEPKIVLQGAGQLGMFFDAVSGQVWGLSMFDHSGHEIRSDGEYFTSFGNHLGVDQDGNAVGTAPAIVVLETDYCKIGGKRHWMRNVIGSGVGGVEGAVVNGIGNSFQNNYIGFNANGTNYTDVLNIGIHIQGGSNNTKIGGPQFLQGNRFGACQTGLYNTGDNTAVHGNWFGIQYDGASSLNAVSMNYGIHSTTASGTTIGAPEYWGRNFVTNYPNSIFVVNASNSVLRNNFIGTDTTGNSDLGIVDRGVHFMNAANFMFGQPGIGGANFVLQGTQQAVLVENTNGGSLFNNRIGVYFNGTFGSGITKGIDVNNGQNLFIGGITPVHGNFIGNTTDQQIYIHNGAGSNPISIAGNTIGIDELGNAQGTNPVGILIENNSVPITIGHETNPGGSNTIRYNSTGVLVGESAGNATNVKVLQNEIYDNGNLGIDLFETGLGVTINDGSYVATQGNEGIDYPTILAANSCDGVSNTEIALEIAMPPDNYIVEVYQNSTPDGSGHGEGEIFLANANITTTTNPETVIINAGSFLPVGTNLSATLTRVSGGTSEFSPNVTVNPPYNHTITITQPSCASNSDGEIDIQATGATSFILSPGSTVNVANSHTFTSLPVNNYNLSIVYPNCQFDTTINLTAPAAPTVTAGSDLNVCENNATVSLNGGFGGSATGLSWSGGAGTFSSWTDPNATYTPTTTEIANGTVTLTASSTGSPCSAVSDNITITFTPAPIVDAGSDINVCEGSPIALTGTMSGASGVNWSTSGSGTFTSNTILSPDYTPSAADITAGSVTLTITSTGNGSCNPEMDDMVLVIEEQPTVNAGTNISICETNPVVNLNGTFGGGATGLSWTSSGSGTFSSWTDPNATYTISPGDISSGTVTISAQSTGSSLCSAISDDITLNISTAVDAGTNGSITLCNSDPVTSLLNELGGTPDAGGVWTGPSTLGGADQGNFDPGSMTAGTYSYNVTNGPCTSTSTVVVTVNNCSCSVDAINYTIGSCNAADNLFDITGDITFTNPPSTGQLIIEDCNGNQASYAAPFSSPQTFSITGINSDGASCNLTAYFTDDVGCTMTSTNYNNPSACQYSCVADAGTFSLDLNGSTVSSPIQLCYNDTLSITANGDYTPPTQIATGTAYNPGLFLMVFSCPPSTFPPNDFTADACFVGTYNSNNGSWDIDNSIGDGSTVYLVPVTMYDVVSEIYSNVPGGMNACFDFGATIEVTYIEEINVTSTVFDDTCGSGLGEVILAGSNGDSPYTFNFDNGGFSSIDTYTGLTAGTYTAQVEDNNGCTSSSIQVVVGDYTGADPSFTFNDFCPTLSALPSNIITSGGTFTFDSPPGDGATIDGNTGEIFNATPGSTYDIAYQVGPCTSNLHVETVTALPLDDPSFTFGDFCANEVGLPTNIATPGGVFSLFPVTGSINSTTGAISNATAGNVYSVVYETPNCPTTDTVNVAVLEPPVQPTITTDQNTYCSYDTIQPVVITNGNNNANYQWWLNGNTVNGSSSNPLTLDPTLVSGDNYVFVETDTTNGCSAFSDTITIFLSDSTMVNAISPVYACIGDEANLLAEGGVAYEWSGDYSTDANNVDQPIIVPREEGQMYVIIEDQYGCLYEKIVEVLLENPENCEVETYNAFSPNGDGSNEVWVIDGIAGQDNRVVIFNRWGQEIKTFENYNNQDIVWDGTNKSGGALPAGTYYYIIEMNGQKMNGWVQLMK